MTARKSLIVDPEFPGGQVTIFPVQVGRKEFQLKEAPGGVEEREKFVDVPEQIDLEKGGLTLGNGLIVIASDDVGPGLIQLVFVPYTCIFPEVALAAKLTVTKASVGLIWVIVAPVPV